MTDNKLFDSFPPVSKEQWVKQVIKDLKGKSFEETLTYTTPDGILVSPFYTQEDGTPAEGFKPLFAHTDWEVCAEIDGTNEQEGNKQLLYALNTGATAIICYVYAQANLSQLLHEVQLQHINTQFVIEGDVQFFINNLNTHLKQKETDATPSVALNIDPIEQLMRTGNWRNNEESDYLELAQAIAWNGTLCINGNVYQQAGAPPAYEIGCLLAHVNILLQSLYAKQLTPKVIQLNVAIGADYFIEIAKLRAIRKVFALLFKEHGIKVELLIHAETSTLNMTLFDEYNNLLRATTAAMAASIGGCNSLFVKPFDALRQTGNQVAERLSRNVQLILKEESYLNQMADVAAGSYFIEYLTEELAKKAWSNFTSIEKSGGFITCLKQGIIQQQIETFATEQLALFADGKTILVGSNKFPNSKDVVHLNSQFFNKPSQSTNTAIHAIKLIRLSAAYEQERINKQGVNS